MPVSTLLALMLCVITATLTAVSPTSSAPLPRGLWLLPRKDACNTAHSDVTGNMKTAPEEIWSYGTPPDKYAFVKPLTLDGKSVYFAQVRHGVRLVRSDGTIMWNRPTLGVTSVAAVTDFAGAGKPVALVVLGTETLSLLDVVTGKTVWTWDVPAGSYLGGYHLLNEGQRQRLVVFPQNSMTGFCFEFSADHREPRLLWQKDYTGRYWQNFGPFFVFSDMDNDGRPEIVLVGKPGYVGVIDIDTGRVKFDLKYEIADGPDIGRPYGLIYSGDVDGDGYNDVVVVSCQVEHYISVIRNRSGKALEPAWSQFIGTDLPNGEKELRPGITSLADINGDGRKELVLGIRNGEGDGRWHTIVFDTLKGYRARLADFPDRYFWGCYDLNGDGRPEIITSSEKGRSFTMPADLQPVDGITFKDLVTEPRMSLVFASSRLPEDTAFYAVRNTPVYLHTPDGAEGLLVNRNGSEVIWRVKDGKSVFEPFRATSLSRLVIFSEGADEKTPLDLSISSAQSTSGPAASWPLVAWKDGKPELICALSDGRVIGGVPDFSKPGGLKNTWTVRGTMPSVWIGPDGRRLVCTVDPSADAIAIYNPSPGEQDAKPVSRFRTPYAICRGTRSSADLLAFGKQALRLLVGFHIGVHPTACTLYDESGNPVWSDAENGPYPRVAAAADLDGDGNEEVYVDNHGKEIIYDRSGKGRVIAEGWHNTIPGRGDGAKYAVPIIGPFGPDGAVRILLSPGLDALEVLDATGARLAKENYASTYVFQWCAAAVAQIRGKGQWDIGMVDKSGTFYCADVNTCRTRWKLDLGVKMTSPISVSSGDVDGDGRDNFLVGLPNGKLAAIDERDGKGAILWKKTFDAGVNDAFLACVDGDGIGEIVVELDDGRVKVLDQPVGKGFGG